MISLSLGHLVFGYATSLAALLLLLWLGREVFRARRERRQRQRGIRCVICGVLYENAGVDPLPACPQCGQQNERFSPPII